MPPTMRCSSCGASDEPRKDQGLVHVLPPAWAAVTISQQGEPMRNSLLCEPCTKRVRAALSA